MTPRWDQPWLELNRDKLGEGRNLILTWAANLRWNKQPPVPSLPEHVVIGTRDKYIEAFHRLTGRALL